MEPVFFALGQAAGTAAALAIDARCAIQDVPYPSLRARLIADGQVLGDGRAATTRQLFRPERHEAGSTNVRPLQPIDDAAWIWAEGDALWGVRELASDAWTDAVPPPSSEFLKFRCPFESDGSPLVLDVSADERFVLLLDGKPIARGPHRGLVSHWYYQTYEIVGLKQGSHVMEAVCWQIGGHAPIAQLSWRGGFILKAEGGYDALLTTGKAKWVTGRLRNTRMPDLLPPHSFCVVFFSPEDSQAKAGGDPFFTRSVRMCSFETAEAKAAGPMEETCA